MIPNALPIAVVDDEVEVLRSIARLLKVNGFDVTTYSSPRQLLAELEDRSPGCIVADLSMPELSGLELQQRLAARSLDYPVVFISGHGDIRSSVAAMRGGAVDFLVKPFLPGELIEAVERALSRSQNSRELVEQRGQFQERLSSLTPREREVFAYVAQGLLNKQIAAKLSIAEKTVKVHRARVMRKMSVRSAAELARIAERMGASEAA